MPSPTESPNQSWTERPTGILIPGTTDLPSGPQTMMAVVSLSTSDSGTPIKEALKLIFSHLRVSDIEGAALGRSGWGEDNVTKNILEVTYERCCRIADQIDWGNR